jgi:hypothetical protein
MAHLLAKLGIFESISEAKKAGRFKPIVSGEFWFKKKTHRVIIEED